MSRTKEEVKEIIDELPDELVEALKPFFKRIGEWEATIGILRDKDLIEQIRRSERDLKEGKTVAWRDVKRNDI